MAKKWGDRPKRSYSKLEHREREKKYNHFSYSSLARQIWTNKHPYLSCTDININNRGEDKNITRIFVSIDSQSLGMLQNRSWNKSVQHKHSNLITLFTKIEILFKSKALL